MGDTLRQEIPQFVLSDSLFAGPDSLQVADSLLADTTAVDQAMGSDIEAEVKYSATDSLVFALDGGTVELYGDASIVYEDITLEAAYIMYDMDLNTVLAHGLADTSGTLQGKPTFSDASGTFDSKELRYNFKTKKAYVVEVVTD